MISFFVSTLHSGQTIPNTQRQLYNKTDIGPGKKENGGDEEYLSFCHEDINL